MGESTNYENLANAIVLQAVKDYMSFSKQLKKLKRINTAGMEKKKAEKIARNLQDTECETRGIEQFFDSAWYQSLTNVDPGIIRKKLREEVERL